MSAAFARYLSKKVSTFFDARTATIDHRSVIGDLVTRADLSGSYLLSIVLANLIALLGLLVNSIAVVIGAMLISPLMGPIFSLGLSFTMGDLRLGRRALYNIAASVTLTVALAAVLTLLSPLKEVTHEILVRTRPNIYDLLIAFFAGIAGSVAICIRKNYLFTTTGVAVATAVIPPLSVVGYGIGTWQWSMTFGGFLLFFTNLIAIVLSSGTVFYILRFRASMVESTRSVGKRVLVMSVVLTLLSVPLVYTLVADLQEATTLKHIERVLQKELNRRDYSRVANITHRVTEDKLNVLATVHTVKYYSAGMEKKMEQELRRELGQPVSLELEQVLVRSGEVPEASTADRRAPEHLPPPRPENLWQLRGEVMDRVQAGCDDLAPFLAPYPIRKCEVSFAADVPISVTVTVAGRPAVTTQELEWLRIALQRQLDVPVALDLKRVPLVFPVAFDGGRLAAATRESLAVLKHIKEQDAASRFLIRVPRSKTSDDALSREGAVLRQYLTKDLKVPESAVAAETSSGAQIEVMVVHD